MFSVTSVQNLHCNTHANFKTLVGADLVDSPCFNKHPSKSQRKSYVKNPCPGLAFKSKILVFRMNQPEKGSIKTNKNDITTKT